MNSEERNPLTKELKQSINWNRHSFLEEVRTIDTDAERASLCGMKPYKRLCLNIEHKTENFLEGKIKKIIVVCIIYNTFLDELTDVIK